jgi:GDP-mannose transporter
MRNVPGSVSSPPMNGEKGLFRNQNAGFTALASPVRREIGNRHVSDP